MSYRRCGTKPTTRRQKRSGPGRSVSSLVQLNTLSRTSHWHARFAKKTNRTLLDIQLYLQLNLKLGIELQLEVRLEVNLELQL